MRIYIIGNDGITLCREAPAEVGCRPFFLRRLAAVPRHRPGC
jgi:hypothetical protein